jgi:alkylated DNA nucleotide flippase Atl1
MNKVVENKRSRHVDKVLQNLSKATSQPHAHVDTEAKATAQEDSLTEQYNIIRQDLMKLRDDVVKGVDLAKTSLNKETIINLIRSRV